MNIILNTTNNTNKLKPISKPLIHSSNPPKKNPPQEENKKFGVNFFTNLNIEQINKGTSLANPTLDIVKNTQSYLKYKNFDPFEPGKHLKHLQKKLINDKNNKEKSRELSPNNYYFRAKADENPELERLFQTPNTKYRKKFFLPGINKEETEEEMKERIYWDELQPISKPYLPKKKVKELRLQRFNHKYKGNYADLEIKGFRGIFGNDDFNRESNKPILKKKSSYILDEDDDKFPKGGPKEIIDKKRERIKNLRMQFLREGWVNGHRAKGGLNFASMAENNLLRRTTGGQEKMKKSVRFDEKFMSDTNLTKKKKKKSGVLVRKKVSKVDESMVDSEYVKICPEGCGRR